MKTAILSDIHVDINRDYPVAEEFARFLKENNCLLYTSPKNQRF